ncbi:diaminopimelate epimerase [Candidatus Vidania fulgoroideorum]
MNSYGNDFVISKMKIRRIFLSDRKIGIGFDQFITFKVVKKNIFKCLIYNKDGSEAYNCLNGLRCLSKFLSHKTKYKIIFIITKSKCIKFIIKSKKEVVSSFPKPTFNFRNEISFNYKKLFFRNIRKLTQTSFFLSKKYFSFLDIGNPHLVFFEKKPNLRDLLKIESEVKLKNLSKNGLNISILGTRKKEVITFERGAGITRSCGTGTAASCFCFLKSKNKKQLKIINKLGTLLFKKNKLNGFSFIGKANFTFRGEIKNDFRS